MSGMSSSKICPVCGALMKQWATRCTNCESIKFAKEINDVGITKNDLKRHKQEQKEKAKQNESIKSATEWQESRNRAEKNRCGHDEIEQNRSGIYICTECLHEIPHQELAGYETEVVSEKINAAHSSNLGKFRFSNKVALIALIAFGLSMGAYLISKDLSNNNQYRTGNYLNDACNHVTSAWSVHPPQGTFRRMSQEEADYYKSEMRLAATSFRLAAQEDEYAAELAIYANQMANNSKGLAPDGFTIPVVDFCGQGED